jgi:hypothetical protein
VSKDNRVVDLLLVYTLWCMKELGSIYAADRTPFEVTA